VLTRRIWWIALILMVSVMWSGTPIGSASQARPDFSGTWVFADDLTTDPPYAGLRSNFGTEFDVTMDEATMTIRRRSGQTVVTEPVITVSTRALWREADVLVSETTFKSPIQLRTLSHYRHPSTEPQASLTPAAADIAAMAWLAGTWTSASGGTTEESWTPPAGGAMLGTSRTIARERMVAFEFLRVVERDGTLVYIAQPGGRPPTEFTLTAISPVEAVFENPAHDYPKVIRYRREGDDAMVARISDTGGLRPQEFRFQRQVR
jgi:hypothetical protein